MAHRLTEGRNSIADVVREFPGAMVRFGHGGKHQVAEIIFGGKRRKQFFASSPSCRHAHKNAARQTRKILAELGATPELTSCHN
jgi:hypothetical protein